MFKNILLILCAIFSFLLLTEGISSARKREKLVIAIQPTAMSQQLESRAKELEDFLEKRLNRDVEIFFPTSYAGVIEALRFGHADAAFMGSWPAALARQKAGAEVVLAEIREVMIGGEKQEAPYYFSYWVVPNESVYQELNELRGKKAVFSSQLSSSGYVAPLSRLVDLGLIRRKDGPADAREFFAEVLFAGGYAQAWESLKAGQADVTVIAGDVPEQLYRDVLDNTRVLEQQGPIPSHAVVVSKDLDASVKDQLIGALLELNAPEYRDLMRKFVSGIFIRFEPAEKDHLRSLERMLELTGFEFTEKKS